MKPKGFYIFTNLAISFDGKIATTERQHIDPSPYDAYMMDHHRSRAHSVLMGASTLRAYKRPVTVQRKRFRLLRKTRKLGPNPINVILARTVDFDASWPFFTDREVQRVIVVPQSTPDESLKKFERLARIFKYREGSDFPNQICEFLFSIGCHNLLLEGGGGVMFPWVERDLIDEWNVTVTPKVIGGENAPTMVEGRGFDVNNIKFYRLKKHFKHKDEMFLQYVRR